MHAGAGHLGVEVELDTLGRLNLNHEPVGLAGVCRCAVGEEFERRLPKPDHDLRRPAAHRLSAPQVEGHALPPPVVDLQADRAKRGGAAVRGHARLLQVAAVLAADAGGGSVGGVERPDRLEHLHLLIADGAGVEPCRRLHGSDHEELEQVVLEHVAEHAGRVVVTATAAHGHLLRHRDLHVVYIAPIPDRLEDGVGEPQGEDVLHRLLAEVVVDAEDLALTKHRVDVGVEGVSGRLIGAEGLFHDDPPGTAILCRHAVLAEG